MTLDTQLTISSQNPFQTELDVLVVAISPEFTGSELATELDALLDGRLSKLVSSGVISGETNKSSTWHLPAKIKPLTVVTIGLGKPDRLNAGVLFRAAATAIKQASGRQLARIGLAGFPCSRDEPNSTDAVLIGGLVGAIGQDLYREKKSLFPAKELVFFTSDEVSTKRAEAIATGIAMTRNLVNQPANHMFPESFVDQTLEQIAGTNLQSEVWDTDRLVAERCETMLAVGRASDKPPRLLILRYPGTAAGKSLPPIALVGKGVTFDSGGLSIKPSDGMMTMKCDMAGGATVVGTMMAIAKMGIDRPVIALVGLVENMISGSAYKLGDVLRSRAGKTIEIHNTDAEGRLVLADVLDVAVELSPSHIIDFATLTGACVVALGNDVGGLMGNSEPLQQLIRQAADQVGEYIWPLPMYSIFDEQVQSKVADLKNVGDGRWGGAITAAKFLEQFVGDTPWAHIDLAGPAFADKPKSWCDAGATGYFVHTIATLLENLGSKQV